MKPEVLVWALSFVIVTGLILRFFSWLRRRFAAPAEIVTKPESQDEPISLSPAFAVKPLGSIVKPPAPPETPKQSFSAPTRQAPEPLPAAALDFRKPLSPPMSATPSRQPATSAPANPPSGPSERRAATPSVEATLAPPSPPLRPTEPNPPVPAPPSFASRPPEPAGEAAPSKPSASTTISPRVAAAAAAAIAMRARPLPVQRPDVGATLPPGTNLAPFPAPAPAHARQAAPVAFSGARPDIRATLPPSPAGVGSASPAASTPASAVTPRANDLRARKLGGEQPSLDERIRRALLRKPKTVAKAQRKKSGCSIAVAKKTLPKSRAKNPPRRIGKSPNELGLVALSRALPKVVGVPQRALRVRQVIATK